MRSGLLSLATREGWEAAFQLLNNLVNNLDTTQTLLGDALLRDTAAEVERADFRVIQHTLAWAIQADTSAFHHHAMVGQM